MKYEHQSIYGDTVHGVPNPRRVLYQNYPSLYHGPVWRYPRFDMSLRTWRERPYTMPLQPSPIERLSGLGDAGTSALFTSTTGNVVLDALLGAGVGFLSSPTESGKRQWAIAGAVAAAVAGTAGLIGTASYGLYRGVKG